MTIVHLEVLVPFESRSSHAAAARRGATHAQVVAQQNNYSSNHTLFVGDRKSEWAELCWRWERAWENDAITVMPNLTESKAN